MLYIQFDITDQYKFEEFKKVYDVLYMIKPKEEGKPIDFWLRLIPDYVKRFLAEYYKEDQNSGEMAPYSFTATINYLEFGLEVDFNNLTQPSPNTGKLEYSALAFPYGGMERLLIFLKAYGLIPNETYNGFAVNQLKWESSFICEATELPDKTTAYLAQFEK